MNVLPKDFGAMILELGMLDTFVGRKPVMSAALTTG